MTYKSLKNTTYFNISKMFPLYKKAFPNNKISLEKYREIFNINFHVSFSYPRCDTCSTCDEFTVKIESIQSKLSLLTITQNEASKLNSQLKILLQRKELHLRQVDSLYKLNKKARLVIRKDKTKKKQLTWTFKTNLAPQTLVQMMFITKGSCQSTRLTYKNYFLHLCSNLRQEGMKWFLFHAVGFQFLNIMKCKN